MLDQILFGFAAVVAFILSCSIVVAVLKNLCIHRVLWLLSFILLFVLTTLISLSGLDVISAPFVYLLASLIPSFLACGLIYATLGSRWGKYYLTYTLLLFIVFTYASIVGGIPKTPLILLLHVPSGFIIVILPFVAVVLRISELTALFVSIGGLLIGVGGVALATIQFGAPLLPQELVNMVFAPLFLIVTIMFAAGMLLTKNWGRPKGLNDLRR
ncbi:MAG: hypothetical protein QW158_04815 [Nitrososphaerales archaeon]